VGAGVNVQVAGFLGNLALLLVAAAACIWDVGHDYSILVYLMKTFSGDYLAVVPGAYTRPLLSSS
jgi:hypothetical protein